MKYIYIVFVFFNINLFSQEFENKMKNDTIYILFEKSDNQLISYTYISKKKMGVSYFFKGDGINNLSFSYNKFKDFDNLNINSGLDVKKLNKRFLCEKSENIIDITFMVKYGFKDTFFSLYNGKKKIYIIDKQEYKRNKIVAREVIMSPNYIEE